LSRYERAKGALDQLWEFSNEGQPFFFSMEVQAVLAEGEKLIAGEKQ